MLNEGPAPDRLEALKKKMKAYEEEMRKGYDDEQAKLGKSTAAAKEEKKKSSKAQKKPSEAGNEAQRGESDEEYHFEGEG
jgi:TATA-binding protein-associated factor Taf7